MGAPSHQSESIAQQSLTEATTERAQRRAGEEGMCSWCGGEKTTVSVTQANNHDQTVAPASGVRGRPRGGKESSQGTDPRTRASSPSRPGRLPCAHVGLGEEAAGLHAGQSSPAPGSCPPLCLGAGGHGRLCRGAHCQPVHVATHNWLPCWPGMAPVGPLRPPLCWAGLAKQPTPFLAQR